MITPDREWVEKQIPQLEKQLEQIVAQHNYVRGMIDVLKQMKEMTDAEKIEEEE